jgi:hypothetical protein
MKIYKPLPIPKDSAWGRKTWRSYVPYWLLNFIDGVKNIITWMPIIYKDKNWDHSYIYNIIEFKLLQQRNCLVKANRHTNIWETNRDITICLNLIQRIKNDYYNTEYFDYSFHLLIDGNYFNPITYINKTTNKLETIPFNTIEGGDNKYTAIAAASILAKVERLTRLVSGLADISFWSWLKESIMVSLDI